ncbi:MAG: PorV/PorQ family protein [Candidatus Latescibacteria bacterium]|nr:PorV/PorQ family protein [Candidatus Latescibacterota bacterium]
MRAKTPKTLYICLLTLFCVLAFSDSTYARSINDGLGTKSFTWLKSISDAGISAAGECFAARDDYAGLLVQPAAVAGRADGTVKMSYVSHYIDTQYGSLGYTRKINDKDIGLRLLYVNYGEFVRTSSTRERLGTFTAGEMGLTLNIGKQVRDDLKVGAMVSYMSSKIEDFTAQAAAVDLGVLYTPPFDGVTVGATLMNLGKVTKSYSSGYEDRLPMFLTVGARKKLSHAPITFFTDIIFPNDNDIVYAFGIEVSIRDRLFLYTGTKSRSDIDINTYKAKTDFSGISTFGFGVTIDRYRFNYAYLPDDALEDIHKITLSLKVP